MNIKAITSTLFTLLILTFTTGCTITPKYQVTIDAITAPNTTLQPSTYELKALDKNKDTNSLRFQQYATPLAQILHKKGYLKVVGTKDKPQQTIYFDYGIEKLKEERRTYIEPDIITLHFGFGYPYGAFGYHDPFYHHPTYYGSSYHTYTNTYYNRYITILAKDQSNKELWRVDVSSVGESKNLRKIIPLLIEASKPYLGTTTKEPVVLVIKEKKKEKR